MEFKKKLVLTAAIMGLGIVSSQAQTETVATINGKKVTFNPNAIITANNGLTAASGNVQFGGALTQASVLTTTSAFTLALKGLQTGGSGDKIVVTDGNGVLKLLDQSSVKGVGDDLGNHTATTALNMNTNAINFSNTTGNKIQFLNSAGGTRISQDSYTTLNTIVGMQGSATGEMAWSNYSGPGNTQKEIMRLNASSNLGIGTTAPTNPLHVVGTNPLKLVGLQTASNTDSALMVAADGTVTKGAVPTNIIPSDVGTVIVVDGKLTVAQEITALMTADFVVFASGSIYPIGNITNKIIDNQNKFSASSTANSFSITENGTYLVTMNLQVICPTAGSPAFGIMDNTTGKWIARVNDYLPANVLQTYTLITSIDLDASHSYSFSGGGPTSNMTVKAFSGGTTGSGPVSFYSIKRLK